MICQKSSSVRSTDFRHGVKNLVIIGLALIAAFAINSLLIVNAHIVDHSMEPTVQDGSMAVAWRLSYIFTSPQVGDVVLFSKPEVVKGLIIKRIVGVPGDRVVVGDTVVVVPENAYFVVGDNADNSNDSRVWQEPFVKKEDIRGKAIFTYFPKFEIIK